MITLTSTFDNALLYALHHWRWACLAYNETAPLRHLFSTRISDIFKTFPTVTTNASFLLPLVVCIKGWLRSDVGRNTPDPVTFSIKCQINAAHVKNFIDHHVEYITHLNEHFKAVGSTYVKYYCTSIPSLGSALSSAKLCFGSNTPMAANWRVMKCYLPLFPRVWTTRSRSTQQTVVAQHSESKQHKEKATW